MTTYEQPKDWIERHLVEDPGGLLACEPSGLNEELKLARQANEFQHQTIKKQAAQIESMRQQLSGANARIELMGETALNQQKREVMLRDEVTRCRDWFETQAKVTSKGGPSSWELMLLRDERDAAEEALASTADLDGLILCKKKPTAWCRDVIYEMPPEFAFSWFNTQLHYLPLYRAWEPKK